MSVKKTHDKVRKVQIRDALEVAWERAVLLELARMAAKQMSPEELGMLASRIAGETLDRAAKQEARQAY